MQDFRIDFIDYQTNRTISKQPTNNNFVVQPRMKISFYGEPGESVDIYEVETVLHDKANKVSRVYMNKLEEIPQPPMK